MNFLLLPDLAAMAMLLSILFFLVASVSSIHVKFASIDDAVVGATQEPSVACASVNATSFTVTLFGRDWAPRIKHTCSEIARDNGANLLHVALGTAPKAMFIFLPLIAFFHMLLYWRPRHRYAEHLLFFLHVHAFFFSVMALTLLSGVAAAAWPRLGLVWSLVPLLLWYLPVYTVLAMRRVFGGSWTRTLVQASALFVVYMVVLFIALTGVFVYAMLQL